MERVVIVGGGIAGLTCAKELAGRGLEVTLYEGLPYLGGRASTYLDADGEWVEQGLHLFLGTYSELRRVLDEIGRSPTGGVVRWLDEVRYQQVGGPSATFAINPLAAPLRTALLGLGQNRYLGPLDKLSALPLLAPSLADPRTLQRWFDDMSVTDWWARARASRGVLERFLRPLCRAIQFTDPEDFSAYALLELAHNVVRHVPQALAGAFVGPRDLTMFRPWGEWLHQHGVRIETGRKLEAVLHTHDAGGRRVTGLQMEGGERIEADAYVLAIPFWEIAPRLPAPWLEDPYFADLTTLPTSPAISVQLWFDRDVISTPHYTLVAGSEAAVYQDQSRLTYPTSGSRVSVVVAPAGGWIQRSDEEVVAHTLRALARVEPDVDPAHLRKSLVLKHEKHLLRPAPGVMRRRPSQRTPVPNLFFAGDWTQQDFIGSQEGAVRGGLACAAALLEAAGLERRRPSEPTRRGA